MRLFRRRDRHAHFRSMIATRMDMPLTLDEEWQLSVHLSRCSACRAVEREYREQRRALRGMQPVPPPRDLWARTSVALDREMAADRAGYREARGSRAGATASVAASLAVFGAAALLVMSQWPLIDGPEPTRLRPTPFSVPGQAIAYLGTGPSGLSIYRTSVDNVCPVSAADCVGRHSPPPGLALSGSIEPTTLALSPSGRQLAITGRDREREGVIAIVMMPDVLEAPPTTDPSPTPGGPVISIPPRPNPSDPIDPRLTPQPLDPTAAPGLAVIAILHDALGAGAPPAWSSDGHLLAFSAMPADGSAGPDLYVWRPGDDAARRMTRDGSTYFASWSGSRIVVSRVTGNEDAAQPPLASTLVIDPETGEERPVVDASLWLPRVNASATHAVAWQGTLSWRGHAATADIGALYLVNWALLDPFAEALEPDPSAQPTPPLPDEPQTPEPVGPKDPPAPTFMLTLPPIPDESDEPTAGPDAEPDAEPSEPPAASPEPPSSEPPESPAPDDSPEPDSVPDLLTAIEPLRDPQREPVRDWEVRWSPDGALLGYWIADVPGSSWGRLAVMSLDATTGSLVMDAPLLSPTLARRSFTLNVDRVAWVGPVDHNPDGELRVNAWGPDGFGVLRLPAPGVDGAIAPF